MAAPSKLVGYECEFVDQVPEDYFCKQCKHVAREPQIASCCTEVFCKACIEAAIEDKKPCPSCMSSDIAIQGPHKKYQAKLQTLCVRCSLKDRGCEWTGLLQHLNAHLDLTTGDCVYVDVDCPSKCNQKVKKRNVDTHLANHCPNRDYTCPHCSFKATFREVSEHFEVCRYYPLVCPNRCGASFDRDVLENHMKMCGLQKLQCEFSYAGCGAEFIRDDLKEHMEQNTQKHLALVAAALRNSQEQERAFQEKVREQQRAFEQKLKENNFKIEAVVNNETSQLVNDQRQQCEAWERGMEQKFQQMQQNFDQSLQEKDKQLKKLAHNIEESQKLQGVLKEKLEERDKQIRRLIEELSRLQLQITYTILPYYFTIRNFQKEKEKNSPVVSPSFYTHHEGYKFNIMFRLDGETGGDGNIAEYFYLLQSVHNNNLTFPARFTVTLELLNQHRDQDHYAREVHCQVTTEKIGGPTLGYNRKFISHADLEWNEDKQTLYLKDNCLKFKISKIVLH